MSTQTWHPTSYAQNARFVSDLGMPVVELLNPQPGERILDLGCGDGALTLKFKEMGCEVVGVDASEPFVLGARALGIEAYVGDGMALGFENEFDAVFSNAALHWMRRDPGAVVSGVYRALKPGGRFAAEMGGARCVETIRQALHGALAARGLDPLAFDPWYFPTAEEYSARLETGGFVVDSIIHFERPTPLPGDVVGWLETFAQPFSKALPEPDRRQFLENVAEVIRPKLVDAHGTYIADYTRVRFLAHRPS